MAKKPKKLISSALSANIDFESDDWSFPVIEKHLLAKPPKKIRTGAISIVPPSSETDSTVMGLYRPKDCFSFIKHGVDPSRIWIHFYSDDSTAINWLLQAGSIGELLAPDLLRAGIDTVVEPDFSTWMNWSKPLQLMSLWKARMCARAMQHAGLKVVPNILGGMPWTYDFAFRGYPKYIPVALFDANHTQRGKTLYIDIYKNILTAFLDRHDVNTIVIYGGAKRVIDELHKHLYNKVNVLATPCRRTVISDVYKEARK